MRTGICNVQQALTAEAASMVKQALGLARRRGHAQITPLHVASAMLLASSNSLLRKACLQSHSHPLQFRALELCFNVALNRLPASTSSPLLSPALHHHLSLSNAIVAAFKRAQAHQRRGSIENQQQQPILIELEHLIISILDDPSVSRVMREAGFSSPQIKTKVEQSTSLEVKLNNLKPQVISPNLSSNDLNLTNVLNTIMTRKGNTMVIGESVTMAESVVKRVMDKFDKGEVSRDLSLSLNLESWPLAEPEANKNHRSLNHRVFNFDNVVTCSSSLPPWMQSYKEETKPNLSYDKCKKPKSSPKEHQFWLSGKPDLLSNPNSSPNSASSSEAIDDDNIDGLNTFKALNEENMNILCNALEKKFPCHKDAIREIVTTILECRSGTKNAKVGLNQRVFKQETWLLFLGSDNEAKQNIARELSRIIFGSRSSFVSISLSDHFVSKKTDSKRKREDSGYVLERLGEALNENPHRVFFIEDMERSVDSCSMKSIKRAIESGHVTVLDRVNVPLKDAVVIFSSERFSCSRRRQSVGDEEEMKEKNSCVSLDLNIATGDNSEEDSSRTDDETGILKWVDNQIMFKAM